LFISRSTLPAQFGLFEIGPQLKISPLILFALIIPLTSGCDKRTEVQGTQTLEAKLAEEEKLLCYQTPQGWVQKDASGQVIACEEAANKGDVNAQYSSAILADANGEKVQSAKWFRLAAEQGHRRSQLILGAIYKRGDGVPKDLVSAYMWTSISSDVVKLVPAKDLSETEKRKFLDNVQYLREQYAEMLATIELQMTAGQIAEAKKLAEACTARYFKNC